MQHAPAEPCRRVGHLVTYSGDQAARGAATRADSGFPSGAGPHTKAKNAGVGSSRLPREITMPTGSLSSVGFAVFGMVAFLVTDGKKPP